MGERKFVLILAACAVLFPGCATPPESIPPAYVSELTYLDLSCEQLGQEQARLASALSSACDAQRKARSNDTAGVFFLGLPVSSLSGSNQASNVGRLKGELEAVQRVIIRKECVVDLVAMEDVVRKKKVQVKPVDDHPNNVADCAHLESTGQKALVDGYERWRCKSCGAWISEKDLADPGN